MKNNLPEYRLKQIEGLKKTRKSKRPDLSHIKTPKLSKAIPVGTKGDYALVDSALYDEIMEYNWCLTASGYAFNYKAGYMHRYIAKTPKGLDTDHINHDRLDNRECNIRVCDHKKNTWNMMPKGKSKYKGVYWEKSMGKWCSTIKYHDDKIKLGYFDVEVDAAKAYDDAAKKYFGEFAYLNFKDNV